MARARVSAIVSLNTTAFQRGLRNMRRRWRAFRSSVVAPMGRFATSMSRRFLVMGVAIGTALVAGIKHANAFRQEMANVSVMVKNTEKFMTSFTESIIKMSGRFGQSKQTLAKGLFDILSAGVKADDALRVLEVSARAATGGFTSVAVAVDGATTLMNAFGLAADQTTRIFDVMFTIVNDGKITFEELSANIAKLAPTARAAGLTLEQMGAAIAAIVKVEKPERAMTALAAAMFEAAKQGKTLFELVEQFGGKSLEDLVAAEIPREAAQGIAILAANLNVLQEEISNFQNVAGATERAFSKLDKVRTWNKLWQTLLGIITRVFSVIDKTLAPAIENVRDIIAGMVDTPGFQNFLRQVEVATKRLVDTVAALADSETRGIATKGLRLVIVGIFQTAMAKAANLLLRLAPVIGLGIATGFKTGVEGVAATIARRFTAGEIIDREIKEGSRSSSQGVFGPQRLFAIAQKVEELRLSAAKSAGIKLAAQLGLAGDGAKDTARGMIFLEVAGDLARKRLKELADRTKDVTKTITPSGGPPPPAGPGAPRPFIPMAAFSELRKRGAKILGAGRGGAGPAEIRQRKMLTNSEKMVKLFTTTDNTLRKQLRIMEEGGGGATF